MNIIFTQMTQFASFYNTVYFKRKVLIQPRYQQHLINKYYTQNCCHHSLFLLFFCFCLNRHARISGSALGNSLGARQGREPAFRKPCLSFLFYSYELVRVPLSFIVQKTRRGSPVDVKF